MAYKYKKIRERIIEEALRSGDDLLPSEYQICERYGVSRTTAIRALNSMRDDDLVRREVGRGTFLYREKLQDRIKFLIADDDGLRSFYEKAAQLFSKKQDRVDVSIQPVPNKDWLAAILATSGTKVLGCSHVGFLAADDLLVPLEDFEGFQETMHTIQSEYVQWNRDASGGLHCHGMPLFLSVAVFGYHRKYAKQLGLDAEKGPRDWKEISAWVKAAKKLKSGKKRIPAAQMKRNNVLPVSYYLTLSGGKHFIQEQGDKVVFDFSHGEEWLQFFQDMVKSGQLVEYSTGVREPLISGESLMSFDMNTWAISQLAKTKEDVAIMPIPPAQAGYPSFSEIGQPELAVVRDSEGERGQAEAAWSWIRFLVSDPDVQKMLTESNSCLSINREIFHQQQADPVYMPFVQALATGRVRCDHPIQHYLMKTLYKYFYAAVLDGMPCDEAAARIEDGCQLLLEVTA